MTGESESFPPALSCPTKPYRVLLFFAAYGKAFACLTGATVLLGFITLWWLGYGLIWLPAGAILAAFSLVMLNCFAELVDLVVDTMIPK